MGNAQMFLKEEDTCSDSGLCKLYFPDVFLSQEYLRVSRIIEESRHMIPLGHMGSKSQIQCSSFISVQKPSGFINESCAAQTGNGVNKTGTTDSLRSFLADHRKVETRRIIRHMIYGSLCSSHSAVDLRPFESRSGGSGTADQPVFVSKDQFPVSSNIQHKRNFFLKIRPERKDTAHGIGPYKTGDNREEYQLSLRVDMNVKFSGFFADQSFLGGYVRRSYQRFHRILEENMVHTGISYKTEEINVFSLDSGRLSKLADKFIGSAVDTV